MKIESLISMAVPALMLCACDDSFTDSASVNVDVRIGYPKDMDASAVENGVLTFRNLSTGTTTQFACEADRTVAVLPGIYDVEYSASAEAESGKKIAVKGVARSVQLMTDGALVSIDAFSNLEQTDLIISEVFFAGTLQNSGNQYLGDDYVKLYNNTDQVIYADGITLFESKFLTTEKYAYTPDVMGEAVTVQALYTIPGSGKEHPVQPGEYILLADVGIDHRAVNPNSFSLAHADWEWYDESSSAGNLDIDGQTVPNLDKWYCYTNSFWMLHNRGFKAYGIARIPIDKETYLRDYRYSYDYDVVTAAGTFPMSQTAYKIPNEWVVDVVNCSVESEWAWNLTAPTLDMGWAYCGKINNDKTRFFHAVRRKLHYVDADGRAVLADTDNSSNDFNSHVTPSEIELQSTVTGLGEGSATKITYDGITPIAQ